MPTVNITEWYMQTNIAKAYCYLVVADVFGEISPSTLWRQMINNLLSQQICPQ